MTAARRALTMLRNESYLTPKRHLLEAQRLLWVAGDMLQDPEVPRTLADLIALAQAHAIVAAVAVDVWAVRRRSS